jgi:hypothetical protein
MFTALLHLKVLSPQGQSLPRVALFWHVFKVVENKTQREVEVDAYPELTGVRRTRFRKVLAFPDKEFCLAARDFVYNYRWTIF